MGLTKAERVTGRKSARAGVGTRTHHLSTSVSVLLSLPLSPSSTVAPQEQLGIMDGLSDHITVSKETWRRDPRGKENEDDKGRTQRNPTPATFP